MTLAELVEANVFLINGDIFLPLSLEGRLG
jgi:hypothetical protein